MLTGARVVIVGAGSRPLADALTRRGFSCEHLEALPRSPSVVARRRPDAVVLSRASRGAGTWLAQLRSQPGFSQVPIVLGGTAARSRALARLDVDGVAHSIDELERLLTAGLKARRHAEHETLERRRLELLLEISRAAANQVPLDALLAQVSAKLADVAGCEQVSLLRLGDAADRRATLVGAKTKTPIELALAPTVVQALETRSPVPLEHGWVFPFGAQGASGVVALVVNRERPFEQQELDLLDAVGFALGQAAMRERAKEAEGAARESLEAAYVERYKELIAANQRLKDHDQKKNELLAVLAHDLRAPLNVLLGHSHLLLTEPALPGQSRPSAEAIQRTSKKILGLVESLLERARDQEGKAALFTRAFDVAETCQDTVRDLQILARQKNITLGIEAPQSLSVLGDEQKIRQVLQNLVMNAVTHATRAQNVTVRAKHKKRPDGDVALVEVCDDGAVIDHTEFLLAFERSHGLGLSICREFVDRHGGEIWADVGENGGGVFAFTLPLERPSALSQGKARAADAALVLVAQDDVAFAQACAASLSSHYRVELVRTGDEVLERARIMRPDVVVMDMFTPQRDGLDVLRELKQAPDTAQIPVLLLANRPELAERLDPLEVGAAELLIRPFPTSLLLNRVSQVLRRARPRTPHAVPGNDPETGLFDHLGIVNRIEQERSRSRRSGRLMSVGVLKPKAPVSHRVRDLAALVRQQLATPDVVGHLGQGVWCVVLPETPPVEAAAVMASLEALLQRQGLSYEWSHSTLGEPESRGAERVLERLLA